MLYREVSMPLIGEGTAKIEKMIIGAGCSRKNRNPVNGTSERVRPAGTGWPGAGRHDRGVQRHEALRSGCSRRSGPRGPWTAPAQAARREVFGRLVRRRHRRPRRDAPRPGRSMSGRRLARSVVCSLVHAAVTAPCRLPADETWHNSRCGLDLRAGAVAAIRAGLPRYRRPTGRGGQMACSADSRPATTARHGEDGSATSWSASPQVAASDTLAAVGFDDQTIREIISSSVGGDPIRLELTNVFGTVAATHRPCGGGGGGPGCHGGARHDPPGDLSRQRVVPDPGGRAGPQRSGLHAGGCRCRTWR